LHLPLLCLAFITDFALSNYMGEAAPDLPIAKTMIGILLITTVPVAIGMLVRKMKFDAAVKMERVFGPLSALIFVLVIIGALMAERDNVMSYLYQTGVHVIALNVLTMLIAILAAKAFMLPQSQRSAIALECGLQNGTLGLAITITILGRTDIAIPSAVYGLLMLFTGFGYAIWLRSDQNDQVRLAEKILAQLEGAQDSLLFASGMAAISNLFSSLKRGQKLLIQSGIYWGTTAWVREFCNHREIILIEADSTVTDKFASIITSEKPDMVFIEVPSNPWILTSDIEAISSIAKSVGTALVVDATAATPILMQPIQLGADIVMHSATKAINGHSDVIAGVLSCANASSDLWAFIKRERHGAGAIVSPHSAWMLIRGMRTLPLRMERMCANAMAIAQFLEGHEKVEAVWYPGLVSPIEGDMTNCPENLIRLSVGIEDVADLINEINSALLQT